MERVLSWFGVFVVFLFVRRDSFVCGLVNRIVRFIVGVFSGRGYLIGSGDRVDKFLINFYILF